MTATIWLSLGANVILVAMVAKLITDRVRAGRWDEDRLQRERQESEAERARFERLLADHCGLAGSVSESLEAIREDINRNYHHTHEGHLLDRMAYRLRQSVDVHREGAIGIKIDDGLAEDFRDRGFSIPKNGRLSLDDMLKFAWRLHTAARDRSGQLAEVMQQPCSASGCSDHAAWLGKTLAIYELLCGGDKKLAVKRMGVAVDAWRVESFVPRYVEDVH